MKTIFGLFGLIVLITIMCLQNAIHMDRLQTAAHQQTQDSDYDAGD